MNDFVKQHGGFSWGELMTTDPEGAKAFYTALFGWGTPEWPEGELPYTLISMGGKILFGPRIFPKAGRFAVIQPTERHDFYHHLGGL